jgi:E3 ubiquitin-protein ligase listerin
MEKVSDEDQAVLEAILQNKRLWDYAANPDPFLRRAVCGLLQTYLRHESAELDWEIVGSAIISKALQSSQLGSSLAFSEMLATLTEVHPDLWTCRYVAKVPAAKRLRQFLMKGSQGGPPQYWTNVSRMLRRIPMEVLSLEPGKASSPSKLNLQDAEALSSCLFDGLTQRDEPRSNLSAAWSVYVDTSMWICGQLDGQVEVENFLCSQLSPLLSQYLRPSAAASKWSIPSSQASRICSECVLEIAVLSEVFFESFWTSLCEILIEDMRTSLPAQSKGFRESQDTISATANRLFAFQQLILSTNPPIIVTNVFTQATKCLLQSAIQLLESRNGKPYGSAAVVDAAVRHTPQLVFESPTITEMITKFIKTEIPKFIGSPSSDLLVSTLLRCNGRQGYGEGLAALIEAFLSDDSTRRSPGFLRVLSSADIGPLDSFTQLQAVVSSCLKTALSQSHSMLDTEWNEVAAFLSNSSVAFTAAEDLIKSVVDVLFSGEHVEGALTGLEVVSQHGRPRLKEYVTTSEGSRLLSRLILLCESPHDNVAQRAKALQTSIKSSLVQEGGVDLTAKSTAEIIRQNLETVDENALS